MKQSTNKKYRHGFVLGKFMPPHSGHEALLQFAQQSCDKLTILVCSLPTEPIAGELRFKWISRLFPDASVLHLDSPDMPQEPSEHPDFWNIWRTAINDLVGEPIDAVFASETYGWRLADELNSTFVPFDIGRCRFPTSGTKVRTNPYREWQYLSAPVRSYYTKRIAVLGPESAGKTTLTAQLANHYSTTEVIEYARPLFDELVAAKERKPGEFRYQDLSVVARGQSALEEVCAEVSNGVLVCDTDVLTTKTWSEHLYHKVEPWIKEIAMERQYDLTLVLHPADNKFVADGQRIMSSLSERENFFNRLVDNLNEAGRPFVVVRGKREERLKEAIERVDALFKGTGLLKEKESLTTFSL